MARGSEYLPSHQHDAGQGIPGLADLISTYCVHTEDFISQEGKNRNKVSELRSRRVSLLRGIQELCRKQGIQVASVEVAAGLFLYEGDVVRQVDLLIRAGNLSTRQILPLSQLKSSLNGHYPVFFRLVTQR